MTREEAIFTLQEAVDDAFGAGIEIITRDGCEAIEMAIEALQERKTGKWVNDEHDIQHCSCCQYIPAYDTALDDIFYSKYCPECGAKMEVDE